jgi:hypothetical protein
LKNTEKRLLRQLSNFLRDEITLEATGAHFYRKSGAVNLGFYLHQIGFPGSPGAVFGVAYLVTGCCMFSAQFTCPRHISFLTKYFVFQNPIKF